LRKKYFLDFPNEGLQHLIALEELFIGFCPKLKYMLEQGLPAFLSILRIEVCPLLKREWQSKKGKEWRKIAHIEQIWIDLEVFEYATSLARFLQFRYVHFSTI